ncbi:MAG: translocation/assembly module TamB domain-containing protein [Acidobacteriaceae bacterium]
MTIPGDPKRPDSPSAQNAAGGSRSSRWRQVGYAVLAIVLLCVAIFAGLLWYGSTPQFAARVHATLVGRLERATGGRVEMGAFRWSVRHLAIDVDNLTIHGKEAADQLPYFHVDHLALRASVLSFVTPKIALTSVNAVRPTLHLVLYPDGTTNQPQPRVASKQALPQTLLTLAIGQTRVKNGLVLLNDRAVPWEMAAGPLQLTMRYVAAKAQYQAALRTNNITFQLKNAAVAHSEITARIDLTRDAVQVERLDLKTGSSRLRMAGRLQNFSAPTWQASMRGTVDAHEVGLIADIPELRNGTAKIALDAHGTADTTVATAAGADHAAANSSFQVTGHVDLHSGAWQAPWLNLQEVELHTNLIVDNDQCSLTDFSSVLNDEGRIEGSLVLRHCVGPSKPVGRSVLATRNPQPAAKAVKRRHLSARAFLSRLRSRHAARVALRPQRAVYQPLQATLQAHVSGVTLPLILAAVAPKPFTDIGFATAASGDVDAHWTGPGKGLAVHGVLQLSAPRHLMGLVPVSGPATATYLGDHRHLVIEHADLHTPGTQVHASGVLTLLEKDLQSNLHLDVIGTDLGEFDRLLTILDLRTTPLTEPHTLPLQLLGSATYHGDVHGSFFALQTVGHLDSQRFQMLVERSPAPASKPTARSSAAAQKVSIAPPVAPPIHLLTWDELHADVVYTPWRLIVRNGVLARGHTMVHAALDLLPERTAPDIYIYNRRTHFQGSMRASDASITELQSVFGTDYPASGTLAANAHATGTVDDLQGAGQLEITHASLDGQPIPKASVQWTAQGHEVTITRLQLASTGGTADGQLAYDYESGALHGQLAGSGFALDRIDALAKRRLPVGGTLGFHLQAAGTSSAPILTGGMQIAGMTLNRVAMGRLHAETHLQNGVLYLTSRADLLQTHLDAGGKVQISGNYPAQLEMTFAGFNVDPLLRLLDPSGVTAKSALQGRITMAGPLRQLSAMQADANLDAFTATVGRLPIHSEGPIRASLHNGIVQVQPLRLRGADLDLVTDGTIDLLQDDRLRLHSEGTVNATLLSLAEPDASASGTMRFVLDARGTARAPDLRGRAQLKNVTVHLLNVTNGLTDMNGELLFDQDRLVVQHLQGHSGGGALAFGGFVGYRNGAFVDLTATTKGVRVRYPKGVSSSVDAKLRLMGNADSMLLSGNVEMMRFGIGNNIDLTSLATGATGVSAPIDPSSPLNRVRLDVHVTSAPELAFQNSVASLAGDIDLHVRGTLENPSVLGRVDISQGSASFAGTTYRLQQGDIVFANPVTISPEIDLEATARVQEYDIIITLHGPPSKLDISYRSEPPLTQSDVLALLALGRTNEQAAMYGEQQQQGANLTSEALLGGALNSAVSSRVQKLFGVGSVLVDPNFVGALGESTARVTVEEQVGKDLTLTFATNINTTAQQLLQAQYDLTRNVSVIAVRDEADVFSMYLQIRGKHK